MVSDTLSGLRDVDDVQGSFLLGGGGELVARDLPPFFHSEIFSEVGPRLVRLRETLESSGGELGVLTLRFADHKLHLRSIGALLLGVVTTATVNGPALRMAINLVTRWVSTHESEIRPEAAPAAAPAMAPSSPPIGTRRAPGVTGNTEIRFKGRKL